MHHIFTSIISVSFIVIISDINLRWRCRARGSLRPWWWWRCAARWRRSRTRPTTATILTLLRSCDVVTWRDVTWSSLDWFIPAELDLTMHYIFCLLFWFILNAKLPLPGQARIYKTIKLLLTFHSFPVICPGSGPCLHPLQASVGPSAQPSNIIKC